MKKLVFLLLVGLLSVSLLSHAEDDKWVLVVTNENNEQFFVMRDSPKLGTVENIDVIEVIGKISTIDNTESEMAWAVALEACIAKQGMLVVTNLQGKFLFNLQFNSTDDSSVSMIANVMCKVAARMVNEQSEQKKSIKKHLPYQETWHKDHRTGVIVV